MAQLMTHHTFGETDTATGIWKPKTAPVVTYGTNGFFLKFENSASFGTDSSPNGNNFTVNGTITQTIDTPSNVFATLNPLNVPTSNAPTFSEGNLQVTATNLSHVNGFFGTTAVSSVENPDDGIGIFEHEVPAGYKALCTKSINATEYN
jgi:hypothetical protein